MNTLRMLGITLIACLTLTSISVAQKWQNLKHPPTFQTDTAVLLTDGRAMVHEYNSPNWWALTPDSSGSYINGTWKQLASMPSDYAPLYFASAVLPDGRVLVEGGEYNFLSQDETDLDRDPYQSHVEDLRHPGPCGSCEGAWLSALRRQYLFITGVAEAAGAGRRSGRPFRYEVPGGAQ